MAVKLVFEDGKSTPSSMLLKKSCHGKNIYFSNGVSQLLDTAMTIKGQGDVVLMFYDVSPNNRKTVKGYEALVNILKQDKKLYKDMYAIPIICIEYYICKTFEKHDWLLCNGAKHCEMIEKLVKIFDWAGLPADIKNDSYIGASLEHAYKNIIEQLKMKCLRNSFEYDEASQERKVQSLYGRFYEKDCNCERKYCSVRCEDTLEIKAEKLYGSLPVIAIDTDEHKKVLHELGFEINHKNIEEIKKERRAFYKFICNNMKLPLFSIDV